MKLDGAAAERETFSSENITRKSKSLNRIVVDEFLQYSSLSPSVFLYRQAVGVY